MKKKPGRRPWSPPDGVKRQSPMKTAKANATPRLGQGTRSKGPYQEMLRQQSRVRDSFAQDNYDVGRTRRMA